MLLECPDVENAIVFKEQNPIMGQIVCANINRRGGARPDQKILRGPARRL
ncbi:MAG: hypothetical protein HQ513_08260 [Rhodospirillales bacterium]|nr:hypothetical protein [Rhodospirillales bacterium]